MENFNELSRSIREVHTHLQEKAANSVNQLLTIRNWLIGFYIVEFEQNGADRAKYGEGLVKKLAERLKTIRGIDARSLFRFKTFYLMYPHLRTWITDCIRKREMGLNDNALIPYFFILEKVGSLTPLLKTDSFYTKAELIMNKLSYTHIELLLNIQEPQKRSFYELECIKSTWSVRELKRQIGSMVFERSGGIFRPGTELLEESAGLKPKTPKDIVKNVYAFEFLDIKPQQLEEETDRETALLNHLQDFILEMGNGFCLEGRQKRILIGGNYYYVDLVFYHRILKCHVLVELKMGAFEYGHIGQLNTYLNFFRMEISEPTDHPPVGILLVTQKDKALVKYATHGIDQNLFVKQYLTQLPELELLQAYIDSILDTV